MSQLKKLFVSVAVFLPVSSALALVLGGSTIGDIVLKIQDILNKVVPLIMTLALIYFFFGLAKYIFSAGDEEKKSEGRNIMIYGVIALFVMASVWGLVAVLQGTFDIGQGSAPAIQLPTTRS